MVGDGESAVYILSAANGIGKTTAVVNILGNVVFGPQTPFFDLPIFQNWPFPKRARYVTNPKNVEEIGPFHSEIETWWPKGQYEALKAGHSYFSQYKARGWVIDVMTYDQEPQQFEGPNIGLILMDEPPPRRLWTPNMSRLRAGGFAVVSMTPLTEAGWFFDEVVPRHEDHIVYADVEENCRQHGKNGQLEHDRIEQMITEYDDDEREARIKGRAMYLKGLIYGTFDSRVHVLKEPVKPPANAAIWNIVDPHSDKPFASIWAYPDSRDDMYIVDEWPNEDFYRMHNCQLTIHDYKRIFADKEQGMNIHKRIIDRHFADVRSAVNKRTLREELRDDVGMDYYASYAAEQEIETGILKTRSYLNYDTTMPLSNLNRPKLYINPHCTNTIKSFQRWARDPKTGKVQDQFKDFMDCVRMLLMDDPKHEEPVPYFEPVKMW